MRAQNLGLLIAVIILVTSTVFSSLHSATARDFLVQNPSLQTNQPPNVVRQQTTLESKRAIVTGHKITATELQAIRNEIGVSEEAGNYNQLVNGYGTGLRAPTSEEWQDLPENIQITDSVSYPTSASAIDNSKLPWFPPIGNQGGEGSCVAWSIGYYIKTFQEAKEHGWNLTGATFGGTYPGSPALSYQDKIMSPEFVYHLINGGADLGASFDDAVDLVCFIGDCSWLKMPYSDTNHTSWPSEQAWAEAPFYRGNSTSIQYLFLNTDSDLDSLKNWLASGNLATIGVDANQFSKFNSTTDLWTLDNYVNPIVNHANTIVGYDDSIVYSENGTTRQGAFKVANSWGKGGWERVSDGFYLISYDAMKQIVGSCTFFYDMVGYTPELTANFRINHTLRSECQITVGMGSTNLTIATKSFNQYVNGGSVPFCDNDIVMDITEFKTHAPTLYNQSYFLKVRDVGTSTIGNITRFAVGNVISSDAPRATWQSHDVFLTLAYTLVTPEISVSPTSGPAGGTITLSGWCFTPNSSANLSCLNPLSSTWVSIINNTAVSAAGQFTYSLAAPDLMGSISVGDVSPTSDAMVFKAKDNNNGLSCMTGEPYNEWRRGLTQVGGTTATGLYGNNTDLASTVLVGVGQTLRIVGKWFSPGEVTLLWDGTTIVGTALANATGDFTAALTVPATAGGRHSMVIRDVNVVFFVSVARMPSTTDNYDGSWHISGFTVNLIPDPSNSETYYRINDGATLRVEADGQPRITTEGGNNILEYWSIDEFGNEEFPHKTLTSVKLDKTAPVGSIQIGNGANYSISTSVTLTLTATDLSSGVSQIRLSNDGLWDTELWETQSTTKSWTLTTGDGPKTVYYQIMDGAGLISSYFASTTVDTTNPSASAGQDQTVSAGSPVTLVGSCQDNIGIASNVWSFGDGGNATEMSVTHTYTSSGTYTATFTVEDLAGNTATSTTLVTVQNNLGNAIPEFPAFFVLPMAIVLALSAVVMKRKSSSKKSA